MLVKGHRKKSLPPTSGLSYDSRVLQALRRIIRSIELYSQQLEAQYQVTGPQLFCLSAIADGCGTPTALARRMHLSASTVVGILDRLENKQLVIRRRDKTDRRQVNVALTPKGRKLVHSAPSALQDQLFTALQSLPELECATLALSLERIVELMAAKDIEPAPMLEEFTARQDARAAKRKIDR